MTLMNIKNGVMAAVLMTAACAVQGQVVVKHLQPNEKSPIANGVWAGETLYLSGQLASPVIVGAVELAITTTRTSFRVEACDRKVIGLTTFSTTHRGELLV